MRPWAREGIWADGDWQGLALKWDPRMVFPTAGRPAGQGRILSAAFPTDVSKGQAAYANDFNKYFFLRNIITEHKLGFNSRLITRGAAVCAGRSTAAEEAPDPLPI